MSLKDDLQPVPLTQPERDANKLDPELKPAQWAANAELVNSIVTLRRQVADYRAKLEEVTQERDDLRAQIAALHPLADGYAGLLAERMGRIE